MSNPCTSTGCMGHVKWQVSAPRLSQPQFSPGLKGGTKWKVREKQPSSAVCASPAVSLREEQKCVTFALGGWNSGPVIEPTQGRKLGVWKSEIRTCTELSLLMTWWVTWNSWSQLLDSDTIFLSDVQKAGLDSVLQWPPACQCYHFPSWKTQKRDKRTQRKFAWIWNCLFLTAVRVIVLHQTK